jgi:lipopolysaccharide transport system ATP-binding protein
MLQERVVEMEKLNRRKPAIVVSNVTKEFIIPHERKTTLFENVKGAFRPSTYEKFTALKDVSFTVERGESVGIIGDNGSGKSTLLKIISKILRPTSGSVEINGRITPFLELGVGFQPDLTARENIAVYSTIMGLSDREIARNMDAVLEFAGLTRFRDAKLKNFSSGMQVRLAFATAIQRTPDILLIDEVLAVGDIDFQQKCLDTFRKYKEKGITMVFVSHDLNTVRRFCDKALLLHDGQVVTCGIVNDVIDKYVYGSGPDTDGETPAVQEIPATEATSADGGGQTGVETQEARTRWGNRAVEIIGVDMLDKYGHRNENYASGDSLILRISLEAKSEVSDVLLGLIIYSEAGIYCFGTRNDFKDCQIGPVLGKREIDFVIESLPMLEGRYFITIAAASSTNVTYDWHDRLYSFVVHNSTRDLGMFTVPCRWVLK